MEELKDDLSKKRFYDKLDSVRDYSKISKGEILDMLKDFTKKKLIIKNNRYGI